MEKHPNAVVWENWISSKEGQDCMNGSASGEFLKNRLWAAFMAGRGGSTIGL